MRYNIKDIGEAGVELDLTLGAPWLAEHCAEIEAAPGASGLRLRGRLEPVSERDFLLRGALRGALVMSCVRCLEPVEIRVDVPLSISYVSAHAGPRLRARRQGAAKEPAADADTDGECWTFRDDLIDLAAALREELLLALPMNPGHDPPCLGICPVCGAHRDRAPCDCLERARMAASPFARLARPRS